MLRNGDEMGETRWKSPEMDELDLVLSQDMREINWERVVFEYEPRQLYDFFVFFTISSFKNGISLAFLFNYKFRLGFLWIFFTHQKLIFFKTFSNSVSSI